MNTIVYISRENKLFAYYVQSDIKIENTDDDKRRFIYTLRFTIKKELNTEGYIAP